MLNLENRRASLSDRIYEDLRMNIIKGYLKPGEIVQERQLAAKYKVSNTPIREALHRLNQEGLIQIIPYKGYLLSPLSLNDVREAFELRYIIEGAAAEMAAYRITDKQIENLAMLIENLRTRVDKSGDYRDYLDEDVRFHLKVVEVAGNHLMIRVVSDLIDRTYRFSYVSFELRNPLPSMNNHEILLEAFRKRDSQLARREMEKHIMAALEHILSSGRLQQLGSGTVD